MSNVLTKLVTQNRVRKLLACYGSSPENWPEDEHSAALALLGGSAELRELRDQESQLDRVIRAHKDVTEESNKQSTETLVNQIVENLPEQDAEKRSKGGGTKIKPTLFYRNVILSGAIAASIIAVVSITVLKYAPYQTDISAETLGETAFDRWAWEEITGESLEEESEAGDASLFTLIDLEV